MTEWDEGEPVTVNTRALIDKVLARYSAGHTTFRELCQNATDAGAKNMVFRFESGVPGAISEEELIAQERPSHEDVGVSQGVLRTAGVQVQGVTGRDTGQARSDNFMGAPSRPSSDESGREPFNESDRESFDESSDYIVPPKLTLAVRDGLKDAWRLFSTFVGNSSSDLAPVLQTRMLQHTTPTSEPRRGNDRTKPQALTDFPSLHHAKFPSSRNSQSFDELVETQPGRLFRRLIVKNDGKPFGTEDWARVKSIAEGNPDENKIGAFGVGFYSVFSECDEPVICSGSKAMAFYWAGNQLCVKTRSIQSETPDPWTTIHLPYRSPFPLPEISTLIRFFATSLTFVGLESICLFIDDVKIFVVDKKISVPSHDMLIPPELDQRDPMFLSSKREVKMDIDSLECTSVAMKASYMRGIIPTNSPSTHDIVRETVSMSIWTAHIKTEVAREVADEVTRASLKSPPQKLKISLLSTSGDNADAASTGSSSVFCNVVAGSVSDDVGNGKSALASKLASENKAKGRVWIGFQTQQTTGFGGHLNTHSVIPTVERENIDFNARHVKTWNIAAMHAAGVLARIMYYYDVQDLVEPPKGTDLVTKMSVIMQRYSFAASTPIPTVGEKISEAFFKTGFKELLLLTTRGLAKAETVRLGFPSDYVENPFRPSSLFTSISFLHPALVGRYPNFEANLVALGMLKRVAVNEICADLKGRILDDEKARSVISWAATKMLHKELTANALKTIVNSLSVTVREYDPVKLDALLRHGVDNVGKITRTLDVSRVRTFVNLDVFYPTYDRHQLYLPPDCIPPELTHKYLSAENLREIFHWEDLDISTWTTYFIEQKSNPMFSSPNLLRDVLAILSKYWGDIPGYKKTQFTYDLQNRLCIPTNKGIHKPKDVYLPSVKWTGDIAKFDAGHHGWSIGELFLSQLGLRTFVEPTIVLHSLMSQSLATDATTQSPRDANGLCYRLVEYIISCKDKISAKHIRALRALEFCETEDYKGYGKLYRPSEVYEPMQRLRDLGLPILRYPGTWANVSTEHRNVLKQLGVQSHPSLIILAQFAANLACTHERREDALRYLEERLKVAQVSELQRPSFRNIAFLPIELSVDYRIQAKYDERSLRTPQEIYRNPGCSLLGFPVLRLDLAISIAERLKVPENPKEEQLVSALIKNPPESVEIATAIFTYLASVDLKGHYTQLGNAEIIPVLESDQANSVARSVRYEGRGTYIERATADPQTSINLLRPNRVFLSISKSHQFASFFDYVDFGMEANRFLTQCGAEPHPSDMDIAKMMVMHPRTVLDVIGPAEYRIRLNYLAMTRRELKDELSSFMRKEPWLLGIKVVDNPAYKPQMNHNKADKLATQDDQPTIPLLTLASPSKIVIVDDVVSHNLYARHILICPENDDLEKFYHSLGSPKLSSRVVAKYVVTSPMELVPPDLMKKNEWIRELIVERATLFFHELPKVRPMHDMKLWFKDFRVLLANSIQVQRKLTADDGSVIPISSDIKAAVPREGHGTQGNGRTLYITPGYKGFDIATALLQAWIESPKLPDAYVLEAFFRDDLQTLQNRGVNVKRILKKPEDEDADQLDKLCSHTGNGTPDQGLIPPTVGKKPELPMEQKEKIIKGKEKGNGEAFHLGKSFRLSGKAYTENEAQDETLDPFAFGRNRRWGELEFINQKHWDPKPSPRVISTNGAFAATSGATSSLPQSDPPPPYEPNPQFITYRSYNLAYHAVSATGQKIYLEAGSKEEKEQLYSSHKARFEAFGHMLGTISDVFGFHAAAPNMFLTRRCHGSDKSDPTFHQKESIFFNLRFFNDLHSRAVMVDHEPAEALIYWFMAMCHVLAFKANEDPAEHGTRLAALATKFWIPMCRVLPLTAIHPSLTVLQTTQEGIGP